VITRKKTAWPYFCASFQEGNSQANVLIETFAGSFLFDVSFRSGIRFRRSSLEA
jgi:hypothetical protein